MTLEDSVQWLVDRALISDLLFSFASALDTKNWAAYRDNYIDGGTIELPVSTSATGETFTLHKEEMVDLVAAGLGRYSGTQHFSTNHQINLDGDRASSRSYLHAVHISGDPTEHWSVGGWYDGHYVRTSEGWKFEAIKFTQAWLAGEIRPNNP